MRRIPTLPLIVFAVLVSLIASPLAANADGVIIVDPPVCNPVCPDPVLIADQLNVRSHRVDVSIADQVATTRIDQIFHNPNSWAAEGTYIFPIPPGAAISGFTMTVDGEPVEAKLLDATEARRIYDDIVRNMRDPALLEYIGEGAIQASVFPIPPGEDRRIEIEYGEIVPVEKGLSRYRYRPDTDFELFWSVSPESIGASVVSYIDESTGEGYFLLLAAPGIDDETEIVAKDVIVVLDTSGSMEGEKIEQAREALLYVLEHLNPEDRFNIVEFSTGAREYARGLVPASEASEAVAWVSGLPA